MKQELAYITLIVKDYDEAIEFYTQNLNFKLVEDTQLTETKRWVRVLPPGSTGTGLLFAKAVNLQQLAAVGNQTGGRVFLFLHTDDFRRDYEAMLKKGVRFTGPVRKESYGTVVVFEDLYGNLWDLIGSVEG